MCVRVGGHTYPTPNHLNYTLLQPGACARYLVVERLREVVKRLSSKSDAVLENARPGAMERWDLSYEELSSQIPAW